MWHTMNLGAIDFNLLKVLDALIAERSATRAGKRLGRSLPAISNALHWLRVLLDDDILDKTPIPGHVGRDSNCGD